MILIDENRLTCGTLKMIGQELEVDGYEMAFYDDEFEDGVVERFSIGNYSLLELCKYVLQSRRKYKKRKW